MVKYKLKEFSKWARQARVADWQLCELIEEMDKGLLGDRLGAHLYKKRIGLEGRGKRGGARTILCYKRDDTAVFLYGFAKNEQDNLEPNDLKALKVFAKELLEYSPGELKRSIEKGILIKVEETN